MITLSCANKGSYSSSVLLKDGRCISKRVVKITSSSKNQYPLLIGAFSRGVALLKSHLEGMRDEVGDVVIESNNSAFIQWLTRGFAKPEYDEEFFELMEAIDDIPVTVSYRYNKELVAKRYATASNLEKVRLTGLFEED